jgi:hypothetical protein
MTFPNWRTKSEVENESRNPIQYASGKKMSRTMKMEWMALLGVMFTLLTIAVPAHAHHGTAAYDLDKVVTMKATITNFLWMNPHCEILFDAKDDKGRVERWALETHPPTMMVDRGWTRKSLNPGDMVTITFHPAKNGAKTGILMKVVLPGGKELKHD